MRRSSATPRRIRRADVDGFDAAAKLVVLAGIAFRRHMQLADIPRRSIRTIASADFRYARRLGCTIRQISQIARARRRLSRLRRPGARAGERRASAVTGRQQRRHDLRPVRRRERVQRRRRRRSGDGGRGRLGPAGADAAQRARRRGCGRRPRSGEPPARPYYLRFVVRDRPGILAAIATALAGQGVNLDAVLQEPGYPKDALPFVITVEPCEEAALRRALGEISARLDWHAEPPLALPMLMGEDP